MTNEIRRSRGAERGFRGADHDRSVDVGKLLRRAPQFKALAKASEGGEYALTDSQQEFLDDFAKRVAEGVAEGGESSGTPGHATC